MTGEFLQSALPLLAGALLHNLWQGLLVAGLLFLILRRIPASRPGPRYAAAFVALMLLVLAVPVTVAVLAQSEGGGAAPTILSGPEVGNSSAGSAGPEPEASPGLPEIKEVVGFYGVEHRVAAKGDAPGRWRLWVVSLWGVGFLFGMVRLLRSVVAVTGLRRESEPFERFSVGKLASLCGVRGSVSVRVSGRVAGACVVGVLRPVVLLPLSMASAMPREQLEMVIAHEFAHLRRMDPLWNLVQLFAEAPDRNPTRGSK